MSIDHNNQLSEFLAKGNINSTTIVDVAIINEYSLERYPFNSECSNEDNAPRTFNLEIYPPLLKATMGKLPAGEPTNPHASAKSTQTHFSQHYRAICSTCGSFHYDLLLNVSMKHERFDHGRKVRHEVIIKKLAHVPEPPTPEIGKELRSILTKGTQDLYSRALQLRKAGYGIGSFAYLRRVIEQLIRELSQDFESKHVDKLIETVYQDLPSSLKNGDNPIKLLWEKFSSGLHELTEEECLDKVNDGVQIMTWVVKEIHSQRNEGANAKEAIKRMRMDN